MGESLARLARGSDTAWSVNSTRTTKGPRRTISYPFYRVQVPQWASLPPPYTWPYRCGRYGRRNCHSGHRLEPRGHRAVELDFAQSAGGALGYRHDQESRLVLAFLDRDAGRAVRPELDVALGQGVNGGSLCASQSDAGYHSDACQVN